MTNQLLEERLEQIIECIFVAGTHAHKHGKWQGSALAKDDLLILLDEARAEEWNNYLNFDTDNDPYNLKPDVFNCDGPYCYEYADARLSKLKKKGN